uniref:Tripeptidyl-peptidase 2 n=1 Tax=Panagrolaimus sp. ES5 TaxID=591445 RepID=A0AC34GTR3_9BILA
MEGENIADKSYDSMFNSEFIFPSKHYMPKEITQQCEFLQKYPKYDGRNTLIAILDTGVDPSLPGLQTTTTGLPKIIDCLDLTGAGDVDTSTIKKADGDGILIGLTERKLKIPKDWRNPSGDWHLGTKPIYELYTTDVLTRIKSAKKSKFEQKINLERIKAMKEMKEHESKVAFSSSKISDFEDRQEITQKLEQLKLAEKEEIESPVADCIVWFDGEKWKACIDTSCKGDLEAEKVMSSFRENHEYGYVSKKCLVTYCITIHKNGNLLEICVPNGSHGSHVAHIAAAHFPDDPEKDGLAPGAQIISLCVGDLRKGEYLTHQALLRALYKCIELKVDAINYSYGKPINAVDSGNIAEVIKKVVEKHGIIFVAAAGNDGPGLSTVKGIHHSIINVGAYLTAEMKEAMYSHFEANNSVVFPFSSRGPCADGSLGVTFCAPGAALTGVSKHELEGMQRKHGTSMSSPNAAGNIACLISAMKSESIPISQFRIKLALQNSAMTPEDGSHHPFSLGAGIIQICDAFEFIKCSLNFIPTNITDIKTDIDGKHGLYLREFWQTRSSQEFTVNVKTTFNSCTEKTDNRVNFECPITLQLSSGAEKFVQLPKFTRLPSAGFPIQIDPTQFEPGTVNYAEIIGTNPQIPSLGPLFRLPISVIIPEEVTAQNNFTFKKKLKLKSAISKRIFIKSPPGSTYATVIVKSKEPNKVVKFILQHVYQSCNNISSTKFCGSLVAKSKQHFYFSTPPNKSMEFCFTQYWEQLNSSNVKVKIEFTGFSLGNSFLSSANPTNAISFINNLRRTYIAPSLEFTEFHQSLNASEVAIIEPIDEREDISEKCQRYRLLLTYELYVAKSAYYFFDLEGNYHKFIDCSIIQVFTESKKYVATMCCDSVKLEIGDYIIQAQIRHSDSKILEKLQNSPLIAKRSLEKITVNLFENAKLALENEATKKTASKYYEPGEEGRFFAATIPASLLPRNVPGAYLEGKFSFESTFDNSSTKKFSSFDIFYYLSCSTINNAKDSTVYIDGLPIDDGSNGNISECDTVTKNLKIAIRDVEIPYINKYTDSEKAQTLFEKLTSEFPKHLPIISAEIERHVKAKNLPALKKACENLMEIAEKDDVVKFYGIKVGHNEDALRKSTIMANKKSAIINALFAQTNLMLDKYLRTTTKDIPKAFRYGFDPKIEYQPTPEEEAETAKILKRLDIIEMEKLIEKSRDTVIKDDAIIMGNDDVQKSEKDEKEKAIDRKDQPSTDPIVSDQSTDNREMKNDEIEKNVDKNASNKRDSDDETLIFKSADKLNDIVQTGTDKVDNLKNDMDDEIFSPQNDQSSLSKNECDEFIESENTATENRTTENKNDEIIEEKCVDKSDENSTTLLNKEVSEIVVDKGLQHANNESTKSISLTENNSSLKCDTNVKTTDEKITPANIEKDLETVEKKENLSKENTTNMDVSVVKDDASNSMTKDDVIDDEQSSKPEENSQKVSADDIVPLESTALKDKTAKVPELTTKISVENVKLVESTTKQTEPLITLEEIEKVYRDYLAIAEYTTQNSSIIIAKYKVAHGRYAAVLLHLKNIISKPTTSAAFLPTEKAIIQVR